MEITSASGCTYWLPDACGAKDLYERLPGKVSEAALKGGDIVPFGTLCRIVQNTWHNGTAPWIRWKVVYPDGATGRVFEEEADKAIHYEEVFRPRVAFTAYMPKAQVVSKKESMWNGTCPRCGKGTYLGAFKLEHEDGGC